ncbi:EAL domain-containing protein [Chitinimonas sp.]|uniref:EAL domain-containing protein n=1 Tax=Chitinimonas sp. TaxID=1934313 RepID=UPI0035B1F828
MHSDGVGDDNPALFQRLIEQTQCGVWMLDTRGHTRFMNARMAQLLGLGQSRMNGRVAADFVDPQSLHVLDDCLARSGNGTAVTEEMQLRRCDGVSFWAEASISPVQDDAGHSLGSAWFVSDISWRKAAEIEVIRSERTFRELFERSQAIKLMIDPHSGEIVAANASARHFYGYSKEEFDQLNIKQINVLDEAAIRQEMARAQLEQRNYFVFRHRLKDGEVREVEVHSNPVSVAGRALLYSIIHDIDRQRRAEKELRRIQFLVEQAHLAIALVDAGGRIRYANAGTARLLGRLRADILGRPLKDFCPQLAVADWQAQWRRLDIAIDRTFRTEVLGAEGQTIAIEVQVSQMQFDGETFLVAYAHDIGEQLRAEGLLNLQHKVLEEQAAGFPLDQVLLGMVKMLEQLVPEARCSILLLQGDRLFHCIAPSLPRAFIQAVDGLTIGPEVGCCGSAAFLNRSVEVDDIATDARWQDYQALALAHGLRACWSTPIRASDGRVLGTFALYFGEARAPDAFHRKVVDTCTHLAGIAMEHREAEARVHSLAFYDPLTSLPNRALLADRVELALLAAQRDGTPLALMFLDLDRFKTINDTLGHAVGDRLLQVVANRLGAAVRESDTVCRLGGDEFVLLLPACDAEGAAAVAEKLIAAAAQPVEMEAVTLNGSASLGIALSPCDGLDYTTLLKHADTAMYRAKERGRNAFCFYRHDMNEHAAERLELESALRQALQTGELLLHYQPQLTVEKGLLYGLEALVRWQHPQWGMISPARFIPVAEESGLIDAVGNWVLNEACRQMAAWQAAGLVLPRVAVNLSMRQFRHGDVPALVRAALNQHGLGPERLTLEITESLMMERADDTIAALGELDGMGVALAVDDFGTGYSSLGYLKRFPVSELKLDQSFVRDLSDDHEDRALASAVVRIGQSLRLTVVAEGVETVDQLEFLRAEGCEVAQGYLFARPMAAAQLEQWLAQRAR